MGTGHSQVVRYLEVRIEPPKAKDTGGGGDFFVRLHTAAQGEVKYPHKAWGEPVVLGLWSDDVLRVSLHAADNQASLSGALWSGAFSEALSAQDVAELYLPWVEVAPLLAEEARKVMGMDQRSPASQGSPSGPEADWPGSVEVELAFASTTASAAWLGSDATLDRYIEAFRAARGMARVNPNADRLRIRLRQVASSREVLRSVASRGRVLGTRQLDLDPEHMHCNPVPAPILEQQDALHRPEVPGVPGPGPFPAPSSPQMLQPQMPGQMKSLRTLQSQSPGQQSLAQSLAQSPRRLRSLRQMQSPPQREPRLSPRQQLQIWQQRQYQKEVRAGLLNQKQDQDDQQSPQHVGQTYTSEVASHYGEAAACMPGGRTLPPESPESLPPQAVMSPALTEGLSPGHWNPPLQAERSTQHRAVKWPALTTENGISSRPASTRDEDETTTNATAYSTRDDLNEDANRHILLLAARKSQSLQSQWFGDREPDPEDRAPDCEPDSKKVGMLEDHTAVKDKAASVEHLAADNQRMWEELQLLKKASAGFVCLHNAQVASLEREILGLSEQLGRLQPRDG